MANHPKDNEIISLFTLGGAKKEHAFTILVSKYGEVLYNQIRRMAKSHELTNDILQNVFIKVFQNLSKFNQNSSLYTWLYRIARNETLNFLEKEKRRTGIDVDPPMIEVLAGHSGLSTLDSEKISKILSEAINTLPEKQAMIFQLRYFEDLSYAEMSAKLGTSEGGLKASFSIARKKIETFLRNQLNL
ncbi:MAG: sigma-70 family RNA polymerase sigma factor [Crocinitomicaceae bacterium]|nr:sigma-70 family RNA polymerase sigma factor [Crocinitomicaceae bacterium]